MAYADMAPIARALSACFGALAGDPQADRGGDHRLRTGRRPGDSAGL